MQFLFNQKVEQIPRKYNSGTDNGREDYNELRFHGAAQDNKLLILINGIVLGIFIKLNRVFNHVF